MEKPSREEFDRLIEAARSRIEYEGDAWTKQMMRLYALRDGTVPWDEIGQERYQTLADILAPPEGSQP